MIYLEWAPYRLFPYEKELALREIAALGGRPTSVSDRGVEAEGIGDVALAASRLTYFSSIAQDGQVQDLSQFSVEQKHLELNGRNGRQATRYGLHGVHEYKGKFNPQLSRALMNSTDLDADMVIDPFVGSGTTLLEALRVGRSGLGIDLSSMAYYMTAAKTAGALYRDKRRLRRRLEALSEAVALAMKMAQDEERPCDVSEFLSTESTAYLERWFTQPAFSALTAGLGAVNSARRTTEGRLVLTALSSILRQVSLQLPEDLRIRRRREPFIAPNLAEEFRSAVDRIDLGLREMTDWPAATTRAYVVRGSGDDVRSYRRAASATRRHIITSPPYATALPYIDTDRLSLVALGLVEARQLGGAEAELIGSREWNRAAAVRWQQRMLHNEDSLPDSIASLARDLHHRNSAAGVGFRRADKPALLYRYFAGMTGILQTWQSVLHPGERAILVVGSNETTAGDGERVEIRTPDLTAEVGASAGFEVVELIDLETWPRYGLHHKNGVKTEKAVVLRRR